MTPITQMRLTAKGKERIKFLMEYAGYKTATATVQASLAHLEKKVKDMLKKHEEREEAAYQREQQEKEMQERWG